MSTMLSLPKNPPITGWIDSHLTEEVLEAVYEKNRRIKLNEA